MSPQPSSAYARILKPHLPDDVHEPATSRLWWLPLHLALAASGIALLAMGMVPLGLAWLVSLVVGAAFAGLTFVAHETLHGAIVRGRRWQRLVGTVAFLPFAISPRLWVAWHNRVHHGHTQQPDLDPDAFPTLDSYRNNRFTRFMIDHVGASRGARAGALALFLGFTIQSTQVLLSATRNNTLSKRDARLALVHTAAVWCTWIGLGVALGWVPFLFGFVLPLALANFVVMAHILTNHTLSPLTRVNDPLLNSLSVTVSPMIERLTLGFGYHVEHHLYPWMSTRHAPLVKAQLVQRWPERYQSMPLWRALRTVYSTPRVYADPTTLLEPRSGSTWSVLMPAEAERSLAAPAVSEGSLLLAQTGTELVGSRSRRTSQATSSRRPLGLASFPPPVEPVTAE